MTTNPLLTSFESPLEAAPFDQIRTEHFQPAIEAGIETARAEVKRVVDEVESPTFANTVEALEFAGQQLGVVTDIFFNLNSAETNDTIQQIAQHVSPALTAFQNDIYLNEALFLRVKQVWDDRALLQLSPEQKTLLEKTYLRFVRNGALLSDSDKEQLRSWDEELAKLSLTFGENVLAETNDFELHLTEEADLEGLPESIREAAAQEAGQRNKSGWVFTLHYPSYIPFLTYARNRNLREHLFLASGKRAFQENDRNNKKTLQRIAELRHERARLLGYESYAHFVLERRMAQSPAMVQEFLEKLRDQAKPAAEAEVAHVAELAKELDGIESLERWDFHYYSEKLRQRELALDEEKLRPYFQLENVVQGVFETARLLYGITFHLRTDIPVYHKDVTTYEVRDRDGSYLALFYADFFPRPGKRSGAWMTSFRPQYVQNDVDHRPHISIVCNFTKPTDSKPSLLTFNEVKTLFHEFGHALHGILANGTYPGLTGTSVFWDFVELPSQILENWCYEPQCLQLFAKHYETKETIPAEWIDRLRESAQFLEGYQTVRQLSFGFLDMAWHANPTAPESIEELERYVLKPLDLLPSVQGTSISCQFSHIFQGGYAAGYYSYKWAEVLDADAFEAFQEKGIFDPEVATAFRKHVLSAGGSEDPSLLYKRFRGKDPDPEALLRRAGLA